MNPFLTPAVSKVFDENPVTGSLRLAELVSRLLNVIILLAGFLMLIWLVWGAMQYIMAGGDKEDLSKARSRIIYAIVGFIIIILAYNIKMFGEDILVPKLPNLQTVSAP